MPKLGDVKRGVDLGLKDYHKRIFSACQDCGKKRWVLLRNGKPQSERCHPCGAKVGGSVKSAHYRGKDHWHWNGGRSVTKLGYVEVWVDPSDPFYSMAGKDGYVLEHRLIMARHLGRCLDYSETVHHRNRNKQDNRIANLELLNRSDHSSLLKEIQRLTDRISELEDELRKQTKTS